MICKRCNIESNNKPEEVFYNLVFLCDKCKEEIEYTNKINELNNKFMITIIDYFEIEVGLKLADKLEYTKVPIVVEDIMALINAGITIDPTKSCFLKCQKCSKIKNKSDMIAGVLNYNNFEKFYCICKECDNKLITKVNEKMKEIRYRLSDDLHIFLEKECN